MASTNQCIGSHYDELKHRVFFFNYNSAGYNGIYVYDVNANTISPLLISYVDSQEDIFGFDPKYPIASVNILYRTEEDGDILHWIDRLNRPMKLNIKETTVAGKTYGTAWKKEYLTVARKMPLIASISTYQNHIVNEVPVNVNNLKDKLFQFSYRWVYRDDTKSCWSPWSKVAAPYNPDLLANDSDYTKNNAIDTIVYTGSKDCVKVEISARQNNKAAWGDRYLIETLVKSEYGLQDNVQYTYRFLNNSAYQIVEDLEVNQLFDYIPKKANAQELLNGNIIAYGGITEGNTFNSVLNVSKIVTSINAYTQTPIAISTSVSGRKFIYLFYGTPVEGDSISLSITNTHEDSSIDTYVVSHLVTASPVTETLAEVIAALKADVVATGLTVVDMTIGGQNGFMISSSNPTDTITGTYQISYAEITTQEVSNSIYKHNSSYHFGIVYFDEFGVTNGVVTNDTMNVITPEAYSANVGTTTFNIPKISLSINHAPPSWAKTYSIVRSNNTTFGSFKTIVTSNTFKEGDKYGYLNITGYNSNTAGWEAYTFAKGDRVRVYSKKGQTTNIKDYPIVNLLKTLASTEGSFIQIPYDSAIMNTWVEVGSAPNNFEYYIEVYTPALLTAKEYEFFYEIGETYNIGTDVNSNKVHLGSIQNQVIGTGAVPAMFDLIKGDCYLRMRLTGGNVDGLYIVDESVSDKFDSKIKNIGRAFVIDKYAKETYFPTTIRYSSTYQQNTNINNTNKFLSANMDEYDRERGDIQRLKTRGRQLRVFQNRACGMAPILQGVIQTADGSDVLSQNQSILNKIQYYQGEYGIGEQYCSLASSAQADYFADPALGAQIRLSNDGITSITETYKSHFFLTDKISKYKKTNYADKFGNGGYAKILGIYDVFEEEYISCFQGSASGLTDYTISFSEPRNAYSSFYDYFPEWIESSGNLLITWKNGELWVHNNTSAYANFYGTQYNPSIKLVFNEHQNIKKHYTTITTLGNTTWIAATSGDINTNMNQQSKLIQSDFKIKDDKYHAAFKRDMNSTGGLYNGNVLKGSWLEINLKPVNPQSLVDLYYVELGIQQPLNNR